MANSAVWSRLLGSPNELATSLFDRYHIVAPADLRDAALKVEANQRQELEAIRNSSAPEFGRVWVGARRRNRTVTSLQRKNGDGSSTGGSENFNREIRP
jgi:hypothetical protein